MTTAERFWFALGWALGDDHVAPEHARRVMEEVAMLLAELAPGRFASAVVEYLYPPNEMRDYVGDLAYELAFTHSASAQIAEGEEAFDAYAARERAEGR